MSFIGGLLGGSSGMGYKAQGTDIVDPVNKDQLTSGYVQAQGGLANQSNLLTALQNANGISNQSSVFNQLQGVANGTGPNPAQAMLAQSTGANVANQAALMAGQRGAGANVGLIARQAAQQGAQTQQQGAGQAATLQANQSLGALNNMGQLATNQVNQAAGAANAYSQNTQNFENNLLNAQAQANNAHVNMQSNINSVNGGIAQQTAKGQGNLIGGLLGAAGTVVGGIYGGPVGAAAGSAVGTAVGSKLNAGTSENMAEGGAVHQDQSAPVGPHSFVGRMFNGKISPTAMLAHGGAVPAMVSPGEKYLNPAQVEDVKQGANPMSEGQEIPGKPKVKGAKDSYTNDTVPAELEEGGIVIPRSITQAPDADAKAVAFVRAVMAKKQNKAKR